MSSTAWDADRRSEPGESHDHPSPRGQVRSDTSRLASGERPAASIATVTFVEGENGVVPEDEREQRDVVACCQVCGVTEDDVLAYEILVSPQGVAHFSDERGTGDTKCGKDATRDAWWWPL